MNNDNFKTLDCIKVVQPMGAFYVVSIKASVLCGLTFSVPAKYVDQTLSGNQRELKKDRTRKISQYVNGTRTTFPNSIILSANFDESGNFIDDDLLRWRIEGNSLVMPTSLAVASIIDGQHRIDGFRESFDNEIDPQDMDLLCSVFIDLPAPDQAEIFATINYNQQKVDKSLAYQLFGYSLDKETSDKWAPDSLAIHLSRILNADEDSPFQRVIKSGVLRQDNESGKTIDKTLFNNGFSVSTAAIVEGIVKLFSDDPIGDRYAIHKKSLFEKDRKNFSGKKDNSPLRRLYVNGHDRKIFDLIVSFFRAADEILWKKAKLNSRLFTTVGVLALFDVMKEILLHKGDDFSDFVEVLSLLEDFDFSDPLFKTSGAARSQIKNLFKYVFIKNYIKPPVDSRLYTDFIKLEVKYLDEFSKLLRV